MTLVKLDDIVVNYRRQGSGPPVVLLHGLAEDHNSWDGLARYLRDFTTYAVDLRGHGHTTVGDGQGTLDQLSSDLAAFLDEVCGPAAVVGYSLGGTIALNAAGKADTPIQHIVVAATSSVVGGAAAEFFAMRIAQIESGDWDGFGAGLHYDTAQQVVSDVDLNGLVAARLGAIGDGLGYINASRAMIGVRSKPLNPDLDRVAVRVDVVGADRDAFCPRRAADIMIEVLPDGNYHEIPDSGHLISVDQPERYGQLIARLLGERNLR